MTATPDISFVEEDLSTLPGTPGIVAVFVLGKDALTQRAHATRFDSPKISRPTASATAAAGAVAVSPRPPAVTAAMNQMAKAAK